MKSKFSIVNIMVMLVLIIVALIGVKLYFCKDTLKSADTRENCLNKLGNEEKLNKVKTINNIYITFFSKIRYNIVNKGNNTKNVGADR